MHKIDPQREFQMKMWRHSSPWMGGMPHLAKRLILVANVVRGVRSCQCPSQVWDLSVKNSQSHLAAHNITFNVNHQDFVLLLWQLYSFHNLPFKPLHSSEFVFWSLLFCYCIIAQWGTGSPRKLKKIKTRNFFVPRKFVLCSIINLWKQPFF